MRTRICRYIVVLIAINTLVVCNSRQSTHRASGEKITMSFEKCIVASDSYTKIQALVPTASDRTHDAREGMCYYTFSYKSSAVFYIGNNVWTGSLVNFENRIRIGHVSYNKNTLLDTVRVGGVLPNGERWTEQLLGDVLVGYANASQSEAVMFDVAIKSIERIK